MSEITVTMPLKEYERWQSKIDELEGKNIENFVRKEFSDIRKNKYHAVVEDEKILGVIHDYIQNNLSGATEIKSDLLNNFLFKK
ncbi:hypothetical protein [Pseudobacillus badius]|uniref:hypothetical protein n=1 Tax=Bacillus badius TaxID=1455 RepID=UPI0024A0CBB1|nr:hypothetical protein [Bacillus badius]GLY09588.1 hypothetical protein Bbad01_08040 [Bacillus badius]